MVKCEKSLVIVEKKFFIKKKMINGKHIPMRNALKNMDVTNLTNHFHLEIKRVAIATAYYIQELHDFLDRHSFFVG